MSEAASDARAWVAEGGRAEMEALARVLLGQGIPAEVGPPPQGCATST